MKFHVTVNVPQILSSAVAGTLTALGLIWLFEGLSRDDFTLAFVFVGGQAVCLWVLWRGRDKHPADRSET